MKRLRLCATDLTLLLFLLFSYIHPSSWLHSLFTDILYLKLSNILTLEKKCFPSRFTGYFEVYRSFAGRNKQRCSSRSVDDNASLRLYYATPMTVITFSAGSLWSATTSLITLVVLVVYCLLARANILHFSLRRLTSQFRFGDSRLHICFTHKSIKNIINRQKTIREASEKSTINATY